MTRNSGGWALVLGPGGPVGTAWLTGLAAGLRQAGVEPAGADLIVGTSAGAIAGALIATGRELAALAELPPRDRPPRPPMDESLWPRIQALGGDPVLDPDEVRRQIGRMAAAAEALPARWHRAGMEFLIGTDAWPADARLLITAVDVESGAPVVWDGASGVPLTAAVAASSAAPGYAEPIVIEGRRYMDGAFGGGSNAHLAAGAGRVVLVEPLGHPAESAGAADVRIVPDEQAQAVFGASVNDLDRWTPVYREGFRQAADVAELVAPAVTGPGG